MRTLFFIPFISLLILSLPSLVHSLSPTDAAAIVSISQTINLYGHLVDTGQSSQLDRVFAANASANFSLPGVNIVHGLPSIIEHVNAVANVTGQHALTTNYVELLSGHTANASTELAATFFGKGAQLGQIYVVYGTYNTDWLLTDKKWRVNMLTFVPTGSFGNVSINYPGGVPSS